MYQKGVKLVDAQEQIEKFQEFIELNYQKSLQNLIRKGKKSLVIDFSELAKHDPELSEQLLEDPENTIKAAELAIEQFDLKEKIKIRLKNLPESQKVDISDIRAKDIYKFIFFEGIVRQSSDIRPQVISAKFECPSCGTVINIIQVDKKFKEPSRCSCGRKGHFRLLHKELVDGQRLVVEEAAEDLDGGAQPKRLSVFLKEDLVEPKMEKKTTPGTKVRVSGIITEVARPLQSGGVSTVFDLVMNANYIEPIQEDFSDIEINPEDEEEITKLSKEPKIFDKLSRSIAPSIMGHKKIKEALLLQLMGGVRKQKADGTIVRGDMHILLVGDPGAGKSALLTFIAKSAPKARYIAGKGASSAGLCVAPDSLILTNPGKIYKIKSLVEGKLKNNSKHFREDVLQAKNPQTDKKIFTLDKNLKIKPTKISQFWKIKTPQRMIKITTQSGKNLTTTLNTKIYTISNGNPRWRIAEFFKIGDYVATSRKLEFENKNKQLVMPLLKSNPTIYGIKKHVENIIRILCSKYRMNKRELAKHLGINENKFYHHWINEKARGNISLKDLRRLANKANYSFEKIAKDAKAFSLYKGHKIKLPIYINKDLLYFAGLIAGDGDLCNSGSSVSIRLSNALEEIQNKFISLSKNLFDAKTNISSRKTSKRTESRRFSSKLVFEILNSLGIPASPKSHRINMSNILLNLPNDHLANFLRGYFDTDGGPVDRKNKGSSLIECSTTSKIFAKKLQLVLLRFNIHSKLLTKKPRPNKKVASKRKKYILKIMGKENLLNFKENINFDIIYKKQKLARIINRIKIPISNVDIIPEIQHLLKELRDENNLTSREMLGYKTSNYFSERFNISKNNLRKILSRLKNKNLRGIHRLQLLANSDIFWEKITNVEMIGSNYDYIYDLTVEKSHNFLVNGFVVHNTASVVKDEFLKGWALEAGAMVLANKGICVLDEMDKMTEEDTSALHEAMEQQTITIAKANIQATLRAQTTVLAAANPKFGRFDSYKPLAEQINMPPALINRFDLIFPIQDLPDKVKDSKIAQHILEQHKEPTGVKPEIPVETLRKYIAYVKQRINPVLTEQAMQEIKNFYVGLRNLEQTTSDTSRPVPTIPITPRQLEALIRLAEGSARIRLSKKITKLDAKRAIALLKYCLSKVGIDPETGQIDIDVMQAGMPSSKRNKIAEILNIIDSAEKKGQKTIPIEDLMSEAEERQIERRQAEEIIEKLKREGELFEPKQGFIQKV